MTRALEIFAGAGGLAIGSALAGFDHEAVVEINHHACETIRFNQSKQVSLVKGWDVYEKDVREFDYSEFEDKITILSGGPPCQPFSLGGKHKGRLDKRDMFPEAIRAIRSTKPKVFVFENVKGLLRKKFSSYFEYILLQLSYPEINMNEDESWENHLSRLEKYHTKGRKDGLGYNVIFRLLNAADYGVPQKRERVFIVGFRNDLNAEWSFPDPTHSSRTLFYEQWITEDYWKRRNIPDCEKYEPNRRHMSVIRKLNTLFRPELKSWVTVRDALEGLPDPRSSQSSDWLNHEFSDGAKVYKGHTGSPLDLPSKTLKAGDHGVPGGENMIAYADGTVRYFSIREGARIQTFPDNYHFPGTWTSNMKQLGNAVPVKLANVIMSSINSTLKEHNIG